MATITYTGTLTTLRCFCGIRFAVPEELWDEHYYGTGPGVGKAIYCPLGHAPTWRGRRRDEVEQAKERARRAEASAVAAADQRDAAERSARALRGHLTRLRRRIANGTCPWCHRHFTNVLRHVDTQHPEHAAKALEATA